MHELGTQSSATWEIPTMSSAQGSKSKMPRPSLGRHQDTGRSDNSIEIEELEDDSEADSASPRPSNQNQNHQDGTSTPHDETSEADERPKTPAYVAPIGKIGPIPSITPAVGISAPADRIKLPQYIGRFLVGKKVNEDGDIVDGESFQVLAHAGGDLPSIVGRTVSNWKGDILGDNGELLGWIDYLDLGRSGDDSKPSHGPTSLFELMGQRSAGLMVNQHNELLDPGGKVVGTFYDNNNPQHRKEKEEREARAAEERRKRNGKQQNPGPSFEEPRTEEPEEPEEPEQPEETSDPPASNEQTNEERTHGKPKARRSESERRKNAESWRKENPGESPSDIFLDVKSTTEGIQLTIRIPTVFGGQHVKPNISFS